MRKLLTILFLAAAMGKLYSQTIEDEIKNDRYKSASNYMAYPGPQKALTEAPAGYTPFYISHYGRHGSRYHNKPDTYEIPYQMMAQADSAGALSVLGRDVLRRLDIIRKDAEDRWGELTELGAQQHRQIMERMVDRFPEVFEGKTNIDARSTTVVRCILSMENAMSALSAKRRLLSIHHNATHRDMYYLNQQDKQLFAIKMDSATQKRYTEFAQRYEDNARLMDTLFSDTAYWHHHVDAGKLNYFLFKVASNIQSTHLHGQVTLYDLFTDAEVYRNWKKENAWWYTAFGGSTINGGLQPYTQRNLLRRIIEQADSCVQLKKPTSHFRYGHETVVMPLTCLLEVNDYGLATDDLEVLDSLNWANFRIFPMACNLQFIFYRRSEYDQEILFKLLLNEDEARLPLPSDQAPYYRWSDFRKYFLDKLARYEKP